ncbi:hypothetical protein BgiBS90_005107, partial [Biomphalaria glabrata]
FQLSVCPRRCNGSLYVPGNETMFCFECQRCHCERPACDIYGLCCPDISVPVYDLEKRYGNEIPSTLNTKIRSRGPLLGCYSFTFVRSCSTDYKGNQTIKDLCQEELPQKSRAQVTYIQKNKMAQSQYLNLHIEENFDLGDTFYKNLYCALCNNVDQ